MKLTEQQKGILKASFIGIIGFIGVPVFNALIGRQGWMSVLWQSLAGIGLWAVIVAFLMIGAKVPTKKDDNSTN